LRQNSIKIDAVVLDRIIENFFIKLKNASSRALFLDYDGTLAPFRPERDMAFPYDGVESRLDHLIASNKTEVIIVSGRAIADLKPLLELKKYPEIWGSHGREHLTLDGKYELKPGSEIQSEGLKEARRFISENGLEEYLEIKPVSLAIHFRGLKSNKILEITDKITHNWNKLASLHDLIYESFDGGLELKIPGLNKGVVVSEVLESFPGDSAIAYLGDDKTDEDAFRVLPDNVIGILVRSQKRPTAADTWIQPPDMLLEFLDRWIDIDE